MSFKRQVDTLMGAVGIWGCSDKGKSWDIGTKRWQAMWQNETNTILEASILDHLPF